MSKHYIAYLDESTGFESYFVEDAHPQIITTIYMTLAPKFSKKEAKAIIDEHGGFAIHSFKVRY